MDRSPSWLSTRDCQRANSLSFSRSRSCRLCGEHLRVTCYRVLQQQSAFFNFGGASVLLAVLKELSNCRRIPRVAIVPCRGISLISNNILLYFRLISILKGFYRRLGNNGQTGERLWSYCHSSRTQVIEVFIRNYDRCSSLVPYGSINLPHFNLSGSEMSPTAARVINR
jgi:hypothetical protein